MAKPYTRRIAKWTTRGGRDYFVILDKFCQDWFCFIDKEFETFGDAVVFIRAREMRQVVKEKTISQF